jgi:hypothetical protein
MLAVCVFPIAAVLTVFAAVALYYACRDRFDFADNDEFRRRRSAFLFSCICLTALTSLCMPSCRAENRARWLRLLVFALFLLYPRVSATVLSFFVCRVSLPAMRTRISIGVP